MDSAKIVPTVGRMVYFMTRGSLDGVYPPRPFAAIITRVYENGVVSLVSFGEAGVRFELAVTQGSQPGQWDWMPFQKDQQARMAPGTLDMSYVGPTTPTSDASGGVVAGPASEDAAASDTGTDTPTEE